MRESAPTPGQICRAAAKRLPAKLPHVGFATRVRTNAQGLQELLHASTGEVLGICASPAIATGTRNFLT